MTIAAHHIKLRWSLAILFLLAPLFGAGSTRAALKEVIIVPAPHPYELPPNADEISVSLSLRKVGHRVIPAIIVDKDVYIPIMDVLDFVKVKSDLSADRKTISGFFIDESETYVIDLQGHDIRKGQSHVNLTPKDLIVTNAGDFLRTDIYMQVFGIDCQFNFNNLDIKLFCDRELPAVSEANRKKNAGNIAAAEGDVQVDRRFPLRRAFVSAGVLDWSVTTLMTRDPHDASNNTHTENYLIGFGGDLFGGDIDAHYNGSPQAPHDWHTIGQEALWRWNYATPDSKWLTQTTIGTISSAATNALSDSVIGFQITNKPIQFTSALAEYTIRDVTEPGWTVELYVNEALVNSVRADPAGNYSFAVPLSYGAASAKLKFYGPNGEVRTKSLEVRIPYTFLPAGRVDYSLTYGTNKNTLDFKNNIAQLNADVGVSSLLTVGGGLKYYKEPGFSPFAPFASFSTQVINGLLLNGQWVSGSGLNGNLSFLSGGLSVEAFYEHPFANQRFSGLTQKGDQRRLNISVPIEPLTGALSVLATDAPGNDGTAASDLKALLSGELFSIPLTLTTLAGFTRTNFSFASQGVSEGIAFFLLGPFNIMINPETGYDFGLHQITHVGASFQRNFGTAGRIGLFLRDDLISKSISASLNLSYTLPWAQVGTYGGTNGGTNSVGSLSQGSIIFDGSSNEVVLSNRNFVERAGIIVRPFLDLNNDGIYQRDEPIVKNFKVRINAGRVIRQDNGIIRVMDLDPYYTYILRNSTDGVENLAWIPKYQTCSVTVDANSFNEVNIPITVSGQISGYVRLVGKGGPEAQGGIKLRVKSLTGDREEIKMPDDFMSYETGEFYNIGLTPGKYQVYPDSEQLKRLHLAADPPVINFELHNSNDGDIIDTLNFLLRMQGAPDTAVSPATNIKTPTTNAAHPDLTEIALGTTADKVLPKLGQPRDILLKTKVVGGVRTISDNLVAGECRLPLARMIDFDTNNVLKAMNMVFHGHDANRMGNQDCLLNWLTSQYGYPESTFDVGKEKRYGWQSGNTQVTLETRTISVSEYDLFISFTRIPGK